MLTHICFSYTRPYNESSKVSSFFCSFNSFLSKEYACHVALNAKQQVVRLEQIRSIIADSQVRITVENAFSQLQFDHWS